MRTGMPVIGDRVQVRQACDETLHLLMRRTGPGTVTSIHVTQGSTSVIVELDNGQSVPYKPHELTILATQPAGGE
jgi:hypothetical protein